MLDRVSMSIQEFEVPSLRWIGVAIVLLETLGQLPMLWLAFDLEIQDALACAGGFCPVRGASFAAMNVRSLQGCTLATSVAVGGAEGSPELIACAVVTIWL